MDLALDSERRLARDRQESAARIGRSIGSMRDTVRRSREILRESRELMAQADDLLTGHGSSDPEQDR